MSLQRARRWLNAAGALVFSYALGLGLLFGLINILHRLLRGYPMASMWPIRSFLVGAVVGALVGLITVAYLGMLRPLGRSTSSPARRLQIALAMPWIFAAMLFGLSWMMTTKFFLAGAFLMVTTTWLAWTLGERLGHRLSPWLMARSLAEPSEERIGAPDACPHPRHE